MKPVWVGQGAFEFSGEASLGRLLSGLAGFPHTVASPPGFDHFSRRDYLLKITATCSTSFDAGWRVRDNSLVVVHRLRRIWTAQRLTDRLAIASS